MLRGEVTGAVWATRRLDGLPNGAFLEVRVDGGATLIAFDLLGCGLGEHVLVATGSVAAGRLPGAPPIDALIIGSIDEQAGGTPEAGEPAGQGGPKRGTSAKQGTSRARTGRSRS